MSLKLIACMVATIPHWANGEKSVVRKVLIEANGKEQPVGSDKQREPKAVVRRITSTVEAGGDIGSHNKPAVKSAKDYHNEGEPGAELAQSTLEKTESLAGVSVALHSLEERVEKIENEISHSQASGLALGIFTAGVTTELQGALNNKVTIPISLNNRVVIPGAPTYNGTNPAMVRLNEQGDGFEGWLAETSCTGDDGFHKKETAGYVVFDKGSSVNHVVSTVEVSKVASDPDKWTTVTLPDLGAAPFIFPFTQTSNSQNFGSQSHFDENYVVIRTKALNSSRFKIRLDFHENSALTETTETVGYFAVRSHCSEDDNASNSNGASDFGCGLAACSKTAGSSCMTGSGSVSVSGHDSHYEMGMVYSIDTIATGDMNDWTHVTFSTSFASTPVILLNMQTKYGGNPSSIRMNSSSATGFSFKVDEDKCGDNERKHKSEWVAYFAVEEPPATPAPATPAPPAPATPAPPAPPACEVTVYEHWPEGVSDSMLTAFNVSSELREGMTSWNGNFPTGRSEVINGIGSHPLSSTSGMVSSVKVISQTGACCQAQGYKDIGCNDAEAMGPIKSNVVYEDALGSGVVAPARSLKLKWGCNDCTMCIKIEDC